MHGVLQMQITVLTYEPYLYSLTYLILGLIGLVTATHWCPFGLLNCCHY